MSTVVPSGKNIQRNWYVIDAGEMVVGRVATEVARILMGKHKTMYTPYIDMGDHVIIVNADKVRLTGKKEDQKLYRYHSGYPGGLREVLEEAVSGMLPKNKLGKQMYRKLNVYAGPQHPHQAQTPQALSL